MSGKGLDIIKTNSMHEPYYPLSDEKNAKVYATYKQLADKESKVIFGRQLGGYKYYHMDQVIAAALERCGLEF